MVTGSWYAAGLAGNLAKETLGNTYVDPERLYSLNNVASKVSFGASDLIEIVAAETHNAQSKIEAIQEAGSAISISDMFEMQMRMNRLSQLSEMSTGVVSAANASISSMARNVK